MAEVLAQDLALTALSPCPQAFCDDASGLKFNPVLYPKVSQFAQAGCVFCRDAENHTLGHY